MAIFQTEILIRQDAERVFSFFSNAQNLNEITPGWLHFSIATPMPVEMKKGTMLEYHLKIRGISVSWLTEITEWEPPYHFVDVQRKGPYRRWIHRHEFQAVPDGTLVKDNVDYAVPGWIFGRWIDHFFVYPDIRRIFDYRSLKLQEIFTGG